MLSDPEIGFMDSEIKKKIQNLNDIIFKAKNRLKNGFNSIHHLSPARSQISADTQQNSMNVYYSHKDSYSQKYQSPKNHNGSKVYKKMKRYFRENSTHKKDPNNVVSIGVDKVKGGVYNFKSGRSMDLYNLKNNSPSPARNNDLHGQKQLRASDPSTIKSPNYVQNGHQYYFGTTTQPQSRRLRTRDKVTDSLTTQKISLKDVLSTPKSRKFAYSKSPQARIQNKRKSDVISSYQFSNSIKKHPKQSKHISSSSQQYSGFEYPKNPIKLNENFVSNSFHSNLNKSRSKKKMKLKKSKNESTSKIRGVSKNKQNNDVSSSVKKLSMRVKVLQKKLKIYENRSNKNSSQGNPKKAIKKRGSGVSQSKIKKDSKKSNQSSLKTEPMNSSLFDHIGKGKTYLMKNSLNFMKASLNDKTLNNHSCSQVKKIVVFEEIEDNKNQKTPKIDLESRCQNLKEEIVSMARDPKQKKLLKNTHKQMRDKVSKLEFEVKLKDNKIRKIDSNFKDQVLKLGEIESQESLEVDHLQEKEQIRLENEMRRLLIERKQQDKEIKSARGEIKKLKGQILELEKLLTISENQQSQIKYESHLREEKLKDEVSGQKKIILKLEEGNKNLENQIKRLEDDQKKVVQTQKKLVNLENVNDKYIQKISSLENEISNFQEEIEQQQKKLEQKTQNISSEVDEQKEKIRKLKIELKNSQSIVTAIEDKKSELKKELKSSQSQLMVLKSNIKFLKTQNQNLEEQLKLQKDLVGKQKEQLEEQINKSKGEEIGYQKVMEKKEKLIKILESEIGVFKISVDKLKKEISSMNTDVQNARADQEVEDRRRGELSEKLSFSQNKILELSRELEEWRGKDLKNAKDTKEVSGQLGRVRRQNEKLRNEIASYENDLKGILEDQQQMEQGNSIEINFSFADVKGYDKPSLSESDYTTTTATKTGLNGKDETNVTPPKIPLIDNSKNKGIRNLIRGVKSKYLSKQTELDNVKAANNLLLQEIKDAKISKRDLEDKNKEVETTSNTVKKQKDKIEVLVQKIDDLESNYENQSKILESNEQNLKNKIQEIEILQKKLNNNTTLKITQDSTIKNQNNNLKELQENLEGKEQIIKHSQNVLLSKQSIINQQSREIDECKQQLQEISHSKNEIEKNLKKLREEKMTLLTKGEEDLTRKDILEAKCSDFKFKLDALQAYKIEQENKKSSSKNVEIQVNTLDVELKQREEQLATMENNLLKIQSSSRLKEEKMIFEIEGHIGIIQGLRERNRELETDLQQQEQDKESILTQISDLKSVNQQQQTIIDGEATTYSQKIQKLENQYKESLNIKDDKILELQKMEVILQDKIRELEAMISDLELEISNLKLQFQENATKVNSLQKECEELKKQIKQREHLSIQVMSPTGNSHTAYNTNCLSIPEPTATKSQDTCSGKKYLNNSPLDTTDDFKKSTPALPIISNDVLSNQQDNHQGRTLNFEQLSNINHDRTIDSESTFQNLIGSNLTTGNNSITQNSKNKNKNKNYKRKMIKMQKEMDLLEKQLLQKQDALKNKEELMERQGLEINRLESRNRDLNDRVTILISDLEKADSDAQASKKKAKKYKDKARFLGGQVSAQVGFFS